MSEADVHVHAMIADACFRVGADEEIARDLRGYLERQGLAREDVDAIVASPPRLALYRRLVRGNLLGVVHKALARTRARMNAAIAGAFDDTLDAFLDAVGPRTHYLRDVPSELVAWAAPRWRADAQLPAWIADLAEHELVAFEIAAASADLATEAKEVALDRPLVFTRAKRLVRHAFAVHELDAGDTEPAHREVSLLVYRDAEHEVRFLELTPLAFAILARLFDGEPLGAAIASACASLGASPSDAVLADSARLLADLGARGVLVGAR